MKAPAQNTWTTGLCNCCEEPTGPSFCLYAWCCTSCAYASNVELMEPIVCCGGNWCGACMSYFGIQFVVGCPCILHMMARGYIRNKYGIPGGGCKDCLIAWCCTPCALCQEHREMIIRGHRRGGKFVGDVAMQAPGQHVMIMNPAPPPSCYLALPAPSGFSGPPAPSGYSAPGPSGYSVPVPSGYSVPVPTGFQAAVPPNYPPLQAQPAYSSAAVQSAPADVVQGFPVGGQQKTV